MIIKTINLWALRIPFKQSYAHSLATRDEGSGLVVRIEFDDGTLGWGECLPRPYVTGETIESVKKRFSEYAKKVIGLKVPVGLDVVPWLRTLRDEENLNSTPAAFAGLELALLDAAMRRAALPLSDIIGKVCNPYVEYVGPISGDTPKRVRKKAWMFRLGGFKNIKLKVGQKCDEENMRTARGVLKTRDIHLDANAAWEPDEAIECMNRLMPYSPSMIEQPVAKNNFKGLATVQAALPIPVMADESLVSLQDAKELIENKSCKMFNVRIAKCGGILACLDIIELARKNSITYQLGCLVGETGILSAAGRHLASALHDAVYVEGSYGMFLLKEDITTPKLRFGYRGRAMPMAGIGLGVTCDESTICTLADEHKIFEK